MAVVTGHFIAAALLLACSLSHAAGEGIYSCVDARGRRLTADRPIAECLDREQKELNPSGTVRRKLPPAPTAEERAREEEKARKALEERNRQAEEKKRQRALLARYPDKATHDKERNAALALVDAATATAGKRTSELVAERRKLDAELEFYKKDPSRVPPLLKRQLEENEQHMAAQRRFGANQDVEKKRINARFDEELVSLRELWAVRPAVAAAAPAASAAKAPSR